MGRLATAVVVHTPAGPVWLPAGSVPDDDVAALVTNPAAWEDGVLPSAPRGRRVATSEERPPRTRGKKAR